MIDVWDIDQPVTVVEFRDKAREAIDSVRAAEDCRSWWAVAGCMCGLCWRRWTFPEPIPLSERGGRTDSAEWAHRRCTPFLAERDPAAAAAIEIE